jgi:orotate phosphoribosyltransferase
VLVIEDLISTGKSSLDVVTVLKNAGLNVVGMVSIFTYGFDIATKAFEDAGVKYLSLTNYATLISMAVEKGTISADTEKLLLEWRTDPANWKGI